jgi:hypothetical protein
MDFIWETGVSDLPPGEDNYRLVENLTQVIRLQINKTRPRNRSTTSPLVANHTPRRLIRACKLNKRTQLRMKKNTAKNCK